MGTDVDSCFYDLSCWESYGKFDIMWNASALVAVNESFIEIEHYSLLICITSQLPL